MGLLLLIVASSLIVVTVSAASIIGSATSFGALAYAAVTTSVDPATIIGDLGVSPAASTSGFFSVTGATYLATAESASALFDLRAAYTTLRGLPCPPDHNDLALTAGPITLTPGIYCFPSDLLLNGALTLDGQGDPNPLFVFQIGRAFETTAAAQILLINGAVPCGVFWTVGSSATLKASPMVGAVLAYAAVSVTELNVNAQGGLFALTEAVTLQGGTIASEMSLNCADGIFIDPSLLRILSTE